MNRGVLADGCFDPLHVGHLRYLRAAALLGDDLAVRVAPDSAIEAKGRKPFQSQEERRALVGALSCVNRISHSSSIAEAIRISHPAVFVKGVEWVGRLPADVLKACKDAGTVIVYVDTRERTSTERLA